MPKPSQQAGRRGSLLDAAHRAVLRRGVARVRLQDVAEVAGMSSASVLYYFENGIDSLLSEMYRTMTARYAESRRADIDAYETPRDQLVAAIRNGIPTGADDEEAAVFWQMDAFVGSDPLYDVLGTQSFEEQASVYERILAVGQGRGEFILAAHPRDVARVANR